VKMKAAFSPPASRNIPFGFAFGNWDRPPTTNFTATQLIDFLSTEFPQSSMVRHSSPDVRGNGVYDIPVVWPDGANENKTAAVLYFLDTHANDGCEGTDGTGCIYASEVDWYNTTSIGYTKANGGVPVPAVAFFHIPLPEYITLWNKGVTYGVLDEPSGADGLGICCTINSNGFFDTALANGDIKAMSCGHDHDNDFHGVYKGIELMYGRKTGTGSYGPPDSWGPIPEADGSRVIRLTLDTSSGGVIVSTWIRLRNGTVLDPAQEGKHQPGDKIQTRCNSIA